MNQAAYHEHEAQRFQAWLDRQQGQTEAFSDDPLKSAATAELETLLRSLINVHKRLAEYCRRSEQVAAQMNRKRIEWALREVVSRPTLN